MVKEYITVDGLVACEEKKVEDNPEGDLLRIVNEQLMQDKRRNEAAMQKIYDNLKYRKARRYRSGVVYV